MILDNFGRPKVATQDGPTGFAGTPWGIRQASSLPFAKAPARAPAPPVSTVPPAFGGFRPGILVDPIPYPQPMGLTVWKADTTTVTTAPSLAPPVNTRGTGGCLLCNTAPSDSGSTITSGGGGSVALGSPTLLTATSGDVPWWLLILGGAIAATIVNKIL